MALESAAGGGAVDLAAVVAGDSGVTLGCVSLQAVAKVNASISTSTGASPVWALADRGALSARKTRIGTDRSIRAGLRPGKRPAHPLAKGMSAAGEPAAPGISQSRGVPATRCSLSACLRPLRERGSRRRFRARPRESSRGECPATGEISRGCEAVVRPDEIDGLGPDSGTQAATSRTVAERARMGAA